MMYPLNNKQSTCSTSLAMVQGAYFLYKWIRQACDDLWRIHERIVSSRPGVFEAVMSFNIRPGPGIDECHDPTYF